MKFFAIFTILAVLAVSSDAQTKEGGRSASSARGRCRADTSLTDKSLGRNAIRKIEQQVSKTLQTTVSNFVVKSVRFNSYCGCTQLTFDMPKSVIGKFEKMVQAGKFQIQVDNRPVYVNALTVLSGSQAGDKQGKNTKTIKVQTSVSREIKLTQPMLEQLQVQLSQAISAETKGVPTSIVVNSVDFEKSCNCLTVTLTTSPALVKALQALIANGYSITVNGNNIALTSLTVISSSSAAQSSAAAAPNKQYAVVETSLSDASVTETQAKQIVQQVTKSLTGKKGGEKPEVAINKMEFEASCACIAITFEMSPSMMTQFQSMVQNGYTVSIQGRTIAFYSVSVMTVVDGELVVATPNVGGAFACFSGDSEVVTPNGYKKMADLKQNELVGVMKRPNEISYEPIWWFIHNQPNTEAEFKEIQTVMGNKMELTAKHLIPVVPCDMKVADKDMEIIFKEYSVFADEVREGSCLLTMDDTSNARIQKVSSVRDIRKVGYYAPLTKSGNILVDDIAASCYSHLRSHSIQHTMFQFLHAMNEMFGSNPFVSNVNGQLPKLLKFMHHAGMWLTSA